MIWDVPLVPQIDHCGASTATTITRAAELEGAPHAPRVTVRLDRDTVVAPDDHPAFGIVRENDAESRGERDLVRCRRGAIKFWEGDVESWEGEKGVNGG